MEIHAIAEGIVGLQRKKIGGCFVMTLAMILFVVIAGAAIGYWLFTMRTK